MSDNTTPFRLHCRSTHFDTSQSFEQNVKYFSYTCLYKPGPNQAVRHVYPHVLSLIKSVETTIGMVMHFKNNVCFCIYTVFVTKLMQMSSIVKESGYNLHVHTLCKLYNHNSHISRVHVLTKVLLALLHSLKAGILSNFK